MPRAGWPSASAGIVALWLFGYSVTTPSVVLSATLMAGVVGLGIFYWSRFGRPVESAMAADDWEASDGCSPSRGSSS